MRYIYNIEYSRIEGNNPHLTVSLVILTYGQSVSPSIRFVVYDLLINLNIGTNWAFIRLQIWSSFNSSMS